MKNMKYIDGVEKETTRMYGPTNFVLPRRVVKDHYVNGIPIKKGVICQYYSVGTHFNSEIYDQPFKFKPERWLNR